MKKRLMSILLAVCIIAGLFAGMSASAYADGNYTSYQMQSGDTVLSVCKSLGLDFYACKKAIMLLNGYTSDADFNHISIGRTIKLPASNADAAQIVASNTAATTPPAGGTGSTGSTNVSSVQLLPGDYVAYYLVPHVVQAGETVYDICISKGINFNENSDLIMKVNKIRSWNRLFVGKTILLPQTSAPSGGSCIVVVAHKVVGGDTVYTLCQKYGISYKDSLEMLQILNKKENLAVIKVGQTLLMPISGTITGGVGGGTGSVPVVPGTGTGSGSGSTSGSTSVGTVRNLTSKVSNGKVSFTVDGAATSVAIPGKTVKVTVTPNSGYALSGAVKVYLANNAGTVTLNADGTFIMPDCDIRVEAPFTQGYKITKGANDTSKGTFKITVNGVETDAAFTGASVTVTVAPKEGNTVENITVVGTNSKASWYASGAGVQTYSFNMPAEDITVGVTYAAAKTFKLTKAACTNGTFTIVNSLGATVSKATADQNIEIVPKANTGYEIDTVKFGNTTVTPDSNGKYIFKMPAADTEITVTFKNVAMYKITEEHNSNRGDVTITVGGAQMPASVAAGQTVVVTASPKAGNVLSSIKLNDVSISGEGNTRSFEMPAKDCVVKVVFVDAPTFAINADPAMANGTYTLKIDGTAVNSTSGSAYAGQSILVVTEAAANYNAGKIKVKYTDENGKNQTMTVENGSEFKMPACKSGTSVTISPAFNLKAPAIEFVSAANGSGKAYVGEEEVTRAKIGETVTIKFTANEGFGVKADSVKVKDNKGNEITLTKVYSHTYTFTMPAGKVSVSVEFVAKEFAISTYAESTVGSTFEVQVGGKVVSKAATGQQVNIIMKAAEGSAVESILVTKAGDPNTVVSTSTSFMMPAYDIVITVIFK